MAGGRGSVVMGELAADLPADHGGLLVVDDEPFLCDAVAASLRFLGFDVTTADNDTDALRLARDGRFDLLVLDVMLPDLDGFDVVRRPASFPGSSTASTAPPPRRPGPGRAWAWPSSPRSPPPTAAPPRPGSTSRTACGSPSPCPPRHRSPSTWPADASSGPSGSSAEMPGTCTGRPAVLAASDRRMSYATNTVS
jgi:Response regulator receiver domain